DLIDNILPSANCIVCLSGETTAFFPYCREETGGGYDFTDYLDADDETGTKRIDHVGIIWQSTNGGNTVGYSSSATGFIGDNSRNEYVWIDDVDDVVNEYHRRIHVRIPAGRTGNALIGAYNSSNEVIWSWHVWSREASNDPRTVNTKLYYTYDWDSNGIYGRDSGRPRVAGYTIMNCNLGAMQDEPSGSIYATSGRNNGATGFSNAVPTFGTLYQWGRKDPFPPITTLLAEDNYGGNNTVITDYNTNSVGNYFDNSNKAVSVVGTNTTNALFHSVPGTNRKEFNEMLPLTIQNPTVFYAGTRQVNQKSSSYVGGSSSDSQYTLTNNYPSPHDGNWILDDNSEHYNRLWGGLDPEHDQGLITKTYDTGLSCLLGDIHMYDDYGEKSIFDPCPYGWRVSPPDLWLGFTDTGLNPDDGMDNVNYFDDYTVSNFSGITMYMTAWKEGATSFFPIQGTRAPDGCAFRAGQCGNYNNATADAGDRVNILHIHYSSRLFKIFENGIIPYFLKSTASPVRCVRIDSVQQ
ncbi:MAG: hypothetical protein LUD72_07570, partial [Bacteroidales bacterium]|nr:hypothetical protein [Bacteroidales bacterium]